MSSFSHLVESLIHLGFASRKHLRAKVFCLFKSADFASSPFSFFNKKSFRNYHNCNKILSFRPVALNIKCRITFCGRKG